MNVKTIFVCIVGTIATIMIALVTIEYINAMMVAPQVKSMLNLCVEKSCNYFQQETYKAEDGTDGVIKSWGNLEDVQGSKGLQDSALAVSGHFYNGNTEKSIYDSIYSNNDNFKNFCLSNKGIWENLDLMSLGVNTTQTRSGLNIADYTVEEASAVGKTFLDEFMTPLNMGICYLDKETLQKICKWQVAKVFMNGQENTVAPKVVDLQVGGYVSYKGFNVYYDELVIGDITYEICNLNTQEGKRLFERLTHVSADLYSEKEDKNSAKVTYSSDDERLTVCIARISYTVPVVYTGITKVDKMYGRDVNKTATTVVETDTTNSIFTDGRDSVLANNNWTSHTNEGNQTTEKESLSGGNSGGTASFAEDDMISNEIIYYIVR